MPPVIPKGLLTIQIEWEIPYGGGSPVTGYRVEQAELMTREDGSMAFANEKEIYDGRGEPTVLQNIVNTV